MNTKLLMSLSALFMAALGLGASFLPQEIMLHAGNRGDGIGVLLVQALGALYLAFAALNWMARANLIGGIYSRPVALANFMHFALLAVVLLKALLAGSHAPELVFWAVIYSVFAVPFGYVLFTHPAQVARNSG